MIRKLDVYWDTHYPEGPPIADWLRTDYEQRWVRFHSMPGSACFAATRAEVEAVLDRENAVLDWLAVVDEEIILVTSSYSETAATDRNQPELCEVDPEATLWKTIAFHEIENDPDNPNYRHLYASTRRWSAHCLDPILRLVAVDTVANAMILSTSGGWLFYPYAGGMDLILATSEERDEVRAAFPQWLSPRSDGL